MENYITVNELIILLAILWLPIFSIAALLHWKLLRGRRWRVALIGSAFFLQIVLAPVIWLSPLHSFFVYLDLFGDFIAVASAPLQAALLSTLAVTIILLILRRTGLLPNNKFNSDAGKARAG